MTARYRFLSLVVGALVHGQASAGTPTAADITVLAGYIEANKAYSPQAKAEALHRAGRLQSLLVDQARFELEVAQIVALADNGHSMVFPGQWTRRYPRSLVRLGLFADGLFVVAAPPEHSPLIGAEVQEINGRDWREVREAYGKLQGGEQSFRDQFVTLFMEIPALMAAAGLGPAEQLALTLRQPGAGQRTVIIEPKLKPLDSAEGGMLGLPATRLASRFWTGGTPTYLQAPTQRFQRIDLPALDATYIRMDEVFGDDLQPFLDASLAALRAGRPAHVILDLRFNMGGDLNKARDFAKALPGLVPGQLYAITSGRTFSAAISTLGYLKEAAGGRLTIVGEPVGDRLEFWAEGSMVSLPGLGAMLHTATERHNYMTGCPEPDCHGPIQRNPIRVNSVQPDIHTPMTFAALQAGRDPALDAIAEDIRNRRSTPGKQ